MRHKMASIAHIFRLPVICDLCNQYHDGNLAICDSCSQWLTPIGYSCICCAQPLPPSTSQICGKCCRQKPLIDTVVTAYRYEEPLRTLLHEFKYQEGFHLLTWLTKLMLDAVSKNTARPQCLIPVPMHSKRLRLRGFNQAAELAKKMSQALNIPYDLSLCKKRVNTPSQASLSAIARQKNLRHAFEAKVKTYQHVALIDDLMTTGNTANEIARVLKNQGIKRVDLWCCARVC